MMRFVRQSKSTLGICLSACPSLVCLNTPTTVSGLHCNLPPLCNIAGKFLFGLIFHIRSKSINWAKQRSIDPEYRMCLDKRQHFWGLTYYSNGWFDIWNFIRVPFSPTVSDSSPVSPTVVANILLGLPEFETGEFAGFKGESRIYNY